MYILRVYTRCLILIVMTIMAGGCASSGGGSSAQREARLNEAKTKGASLVAAGDYNAALELLAPLAEEASGDAQVFVLIGECREGLGDDAGAIRNYEQAMRLSYNLPAPHLKLATLLMRQGKIGRALTEFELAIEFDDRDALAHYNYGLALYRMDRRDEALEQWRRARDLDRDNPAFAEAVGIGLTATDPQQAVEAFHDAEVLGAHSAAFENNYGLALVELKKNGEARRRFGAAVEQDPHNEEYRFNLSASLTRGGKYADAAREWEHMLEEFGEHWSYLVYLARCRLEMRQFAGSIEALADIAGRFESGAIGPGDDVVDRVPPGLDEALMVLALASRGLGKDREALEYARRAVALESRNLSHLNNYGVILAENGMVEEAKERWREVLEIDPDNATARENLSSVGR